MPMKGSIQVSARVASDLEGSNLKGRSGSVVRLMRHVVMGKKGVEFRNRQSGIGRHARLQYVAQIQNHAIQTRPDQHAFASENATLECVNYNVLLKVHSLW